MDTIRETTPRPPQYRVEIIPRQHSVVFYDESHQLNYIASCQVFTYGDVGLMYTINGSRFYDALTRDGMLAGLMTRLGVQTLEGYVTPAHARLMRFALRHVAAVEEAKTGKMAGHDMVWVVVRAK